MAKQEEDQADIISIYLPKQLTNKEIEAIVTRVIIKSNSNGLKDMGKVIRLVVNEIKEEQMERKYRCCKTKTIRLNTTHFILIILFNWPSSSTG